MRNHRIATAVAVAALLLFAFLAYRHYSSGDRQDRREAMLALLPADSGAVVFVDLRELRASSFLAELFRWAPQVTPDADYTQFLEATGFHYETDLDRLAFAIDRQAQNTTAFAVADGRFDRTKILAWASRYGSLETADGKTLFDVPLSASQRRVFFTFLGNNRMVWANDSNYFFQQARDRSAAQWHEHLLRVAGTPLFAVLRQDSGATAALAQAPGGLRSPQLAALLAQLQWISISVKPEASVLRVSIEGECVAESTEHQLKEMLSGLVVLAQMGMNDPKARKQLQPAVREGYIKLLESADIEQVDRGTSKTVRVVFDVSHELLESAPSALDAGLPARPPR